MANFKKNLQESLVRPTNHTEIINTADVENIFSYLYVNLTPAAKNSFIVKTDKKGHKVTTLLQH